MTFSELGGCHLAWHGGVSVRSDAALQLSRAQGHGGAQERQHVLGAVAFTPLLSAAGSWFEREVSGGTSEG